MSVTFDLKSTDIECAQHCNDRVCAILFKDGKLDQVGRRLNRLTRGFLDRIRKDENFFERKSGDIVSLPFPPGMATSALDLLIIDRISSTEELRAAGATLGRHVGSQNALILMGSLKKAYNFMLGCALRLYSFESHSNRGSTGIPGEVTFMHNNSSSLSSDMATLKAVVSGVHFTRDLVNEPANILTTNEFARRLKELEALGIQVEVIDEERMAKLGMEALLCVGRGSSSPSKMVIMHWKGDSETKSPLVLVGKGVVFDTGGISLKNASGMSEMIMDMGGAGVVAGTLKTLALRKAKANVVGLVGLVENMPSGTAVRPGDVITSMKGDTIEVLNTDAEGRLILSDVMWYAQQTFNPKVIIDLATLTGAIIVALGSEKAGLFSNNDVLSKSLCKAAATESEGLWRMPISKEYDKLIDSNVADIANMGSAGRGASSIVAAQFLHRFVKENVAWAHIDIAGVTYSKKGGKYSPSGATGWGVMTLNRLVHDTMEKA